MRSVVSKCFIFIGLFAAAAAPAQAQSVAEPNTVTVTPFLSISFGTGEGRTSSLGLGGAFGYDFTSKLGVEVELGHVFDVANDSDNLDWSLTNVSANVVYHFDVPRVTPYATFGLGFERSSPDFELIDPVAGNALVQGSSTEIAWNFGGGVKVPLNDLFLARADLRRFQVNDLAPDHWRLYGGVTWWVKR